MLHLANSKPLPWIDRPVKELLRLSGPIAISYLSGNVMMVMSTLFLSWLGPEEVAGAGVAGTAAWFLLCIGPGLAMGGKTLVAQAVGAGEQERIGGYIGASIAWGLGLGLLLAAQAPFTSDWVAAGCASEASGRHAKVWYEIGMLTAPGLFVASAICQARQGLGDARSTVFASVFANILNVALAALFILHLKWGVAGSAWARVLAQTVEMVLLASVQWRSGLRLSARWNDAVEVIRMGLPMSLHFVLEMVSFGLMTLIVASTGDANSAAHQVALRVVIFLMLAQYALGDALAALCGQAVGAERPDLVGWLARKASALVTGYNVLCAVLLAAFASAIASAFTRDPKVQVHTVHLFWLSGLVLLGDGAVLMARRALGGVGDVRYVAVLGVTASWISLAPLAWLFGVHLGLGVEGTWIALAAEVVIAAVLFWRRLSSMRWQKRAGAEPVEEPPTEVAALAGG